MPLKFLAASCAVLALFAVPAMAEPAPAPTPAAPAAAASPTVAEAATPSPIIKAVVERLDMASLVSAQSREALDHDALKAFYAARTAPLWVTPNGLTPEAEALIREIENAAAYGLDPKAFRLPKRDVGAQSATGTAQLADAELTLSTTALTYARHARGGRIPEPAEQLNSNLDRKPQWRDPNEVLAALASAPNPADVLVALHPKHPQFERLRQAYLAALPKPGSNQPLPALAKRLRANMEMWRWMWDDLGPLHVFNNIPEFMQTVYLDGRVIRREKIVAGLIDKQSSVFSRPLKYVVLRPAWRVPESIKVNELWPSLIRGGGYMRQYGLQLQTKDGRPLDWRSIDWTKADVRNYEVLQPPGPKSVLGHVKFSFPSQHTIFMHDTPDKWMFRATQRTLSHGCLRVDKPMDLARIILKDDKGWDADKVAEVSRSGPLNNEIEITKKIPIHLAYFTAWVNDDGRLALFNDVYGHEKRVTQALDGQWDKINKGRNHLAPVEPRFNPEKVAQRAAPQRRFLPASAQPGATLGDIISNALSVGD